MHKSLLLVSIFFVSSCAVRKQPSAIVDPLQQLINDSSLVTAHVGVAVYDPVEKKYLYDFQGDKYFVPASNTKISTLYAALKYLGDSIAAAEIEEREDYVRLTPAGDPTVLKTEFKFQPLISYLKSLKPGRPVLVSDPARMRSLGSGWAWNDYDAAYMAERSAFPLYGNVVSFSRRTNHLEITPSLFRDSTKVLSSPWKAGTVRRSQYRNEFSVIIPSTGQLTAQVPFISSVPLSMKLLNDSLKLSLYMPEPEDPTIVEPLSGRQRKFTVYSQPVDSLMKVMMHRSDNFFAEQTLLMVSYTMLGIMSDAAIIDTILKTEFKDLPQRPRWADGSGLSRYNLFSPKDFVMIIDKMEREFGLARLSEIFPTGNEGTLTNYYKDDSLIIYAKTGTLSGVVALSGYLYKFRLHQPPKMLIFSVLVNNHQASATAVRRAVEKFIQQVRKDWEH